MTKNDYRELMKSVLKMQIGYIYEAMNECSDYERGLYLEGKVAGLEIAIQKLDDSSFLTEVE